MLALWKVRRAYIHHQNFKIWNQSPFLKKNFTTTKRNHGVKCNTKQWIWFLSETAERDAINHVYQQEYGGFNEPLFKIFGGLVVEIKVFTRPPCIFWKYFLQNHFMFNDRHDSLSISNSRTFPSVNRFLMILDSHLACVKRGETEERRWIHHANGDHCSTSVEKLSWWILTFRG